MVKISYNGTFYEGRLVYLDPMTKTYTGEDGSSVYKNVAYRITIMDAFGAVISLTLPNLYCIEFV